MNNKEQIIKIREKLEMLVEVDRLSRREAISLLLDKEKKFEERVRHANYVSGVNAAYKTICEEFNLHYNPIKSDIDIH